MKIGVKRKAKESMKDLAKIIKRTKEKEGSWKKTIVDQKRQEDSKNGDGGVIEPEIVIEAVIEKKENLVRVLKNEKQLERSMEEARG